MVLRICLSTALTAAAAAAVVTQSLAELDTSVKQANESKGEHYAGAGFFEKFDGPTGLNHSLFQTSGWWYNGQPFATGWDPGYWTVIKDSILVLSLRKERYQTGSADVPYTGGEIQSKAEYRAGCYSVCMKAAAPSGVASAFFLHNFGEQGNTLGSQLNEIDIEFIGKERNKVQTNFFSRLYDPNANSGSGNEQMHDVGYDVHQNYGAYSIRWREDRIDWWVNGYNVRTEFVTTDGPKLPLPHELGLKISANVWAVNKQAEEWAGPLDTSFYETQSRYAWIHHDPGENCDIKTNCGDLPAGV